MATLAGRPADRLKFLLFGYSRVVASRTSLGLFNPFLADGLDDFFCDFVFMYFFE